MAACRSELFLYGLCFFPSWSCLVGLGCLVRFRLYVTQTLHLCAMHKRAVQRIPDVSSGFRHTFCRHRSGGTRRSTTIRFADAPPAKRERGHDRSTSKQQVVAEELRKILSPEACSWLEGKPLRTKVDVKGKGKVPSGELSQLTMDAPPSKEQQQFAALDQPRDLSLPESGDVDAFVDETARIPAGSLIEIRRCI